MVEDLLIMILSFVLGVLSTIGYTKWRMVSSPVALPDDRHLLVEVDDLKIWLAEAQNSSEQTDQLAKEIHTKIYGV
jgi:hypothetical protein